MKNLFQYLVFVMIVLVIAGCSEQKNSTPLTQTPVSVHGVGFANPSSSNFHAKFIQSKNYDLTLCQSCHGSTYTGGTTGQSCNTCHSKPNGPENCTTCHGGVNAAPPNDLVGNSSPTIRGVGAHQKHVSGGNLGAAVECATCHTVPSSVKSVGHIDASVHAEVKFDSISTMYRSNAAYSSTGNSCSNTYCHGNFNGGNQNVTMTWTDANSSAAACGTCHGDVTKTTTQEKAFPKTGHTFVSVTAVCSSCHSSVAIVNSNLTIADPAKHMNGKID